MNINRYLRTHSFSNHEGLLRRIAEYWLVVQLVGVLYAKGLQVQSLVGTGTEGNQWIPLSKKSMKHILG